MCKFIYDSREYKYLQDPGERTIEVPVAWHLLAGYDYKKVLEVGNVMWSRACRHWMDWHYVVDKYEKLDGIIDNTDIIDFNPDKLYNLILCISTIEHVGYDETPRDVSKCLEAYDKMKSLLSPGGMLFITWPFGYNKYIDQYLFNGSFDFTDTLFMKRISEDNKWIECGLEEAKTAKYAYPYEAGNALVFGYYIKVE